MYSTPRPGRYTGVQYNTSTVFLVEVGISQEFRGILPRTPDRLGVEEARVVAQTILWWWALVTAAVLGLATSSRNFGLCFLSTIPGGVKCGPCTPSQGWLKVACVAYSTVLYYQSS